MAFPLDLTAAMATASVRAYVYMCVCACNSGRCACNFYCNCIICKLNNKRPSNINHCSFMARRWDNVYIFQWTMTRIHANRVKHEVRRVRASAPVTWAALSSVCVRVCVSRSLVALFSYRLPYNKQQCSHAHTWTIEKKADERNGFGKPNIAFIIFGKFTMAICNVRLS